MDKYRRVENKDKNQPQSPDQIRIKAGDRSIYPYLSYAHRHFDEGNQEVIIKACGNAISKAVQVVELIKRRFKGLHQQNEITSLEVEDVYEPIEQGLDPVTRTRRLTMFVCSLSKSAKDQNHYGYQPPLPLQQVQQFQPAPQRRGAPRQFRYGPRYYSRGSYYRGGRGRGNHPRDYERGPRYQGGRGGYGYGGGYNRSYNQRREEDYDEEYEDQRPRGRGFRGGRGGYRPRGGYDGQRRYDNNRKDNGPRPRDGEDYKEERPQPRQDGRYYQDNQRYYQDNQRYYQDNQRYQEDRRNYNDQRDRQYDRPFNRGRARGYQRGRGRGRGGDHQRFNP